MANELRLYVIAREDLSNVPIGKWMVQAGHAFSGTLLNSTFECSWLPKKITYLIGLGLSKLYDYQLNDKHPKIVLKVPGEEGILKLAEMCRYHTIPFHIVTDLGLTVFNQPTTTCIGIGPITKEDADRLLNLRGLAKF